MKNRRAVTLIELLLIMSASTVLLTLTGVLLSRAMRIQMQSRACDNAERASLRLSNQFRTDVHHARAVIAASDPKDNAAFLRLEMEGGRITEYKREGHNVLRFESGRHRPDRVEEYAFPAAGDLRIDEKQAPHQLALTITVSPGNLVSTDGKTFAGVSMVPLSLSVESVVGRDLQVSISPRGSEEQK